MIIEGKVRNYLSNNIWYHATTLDNWNSICENGILANFNKDSSDALDFGYGFYLTPTRERSEKYITGLANAGVLDGEQLIILGFKLNVLELFENSTYNTKIMNKYNEEFAVFVFENRVYNYRGCKQHNYDIIFGVMSDRLPIKIIADYKVGIIDKEEAIKLLQKDTTMKQLSLHNQEICDIMVLEEAYILDKETGERKELDVNAYCNNR